MRILFLRFDQMPANAGDGRVLCRQCVSIFLRGSSVQLIDLPLNPALNTDAHRRVFSPPAVAG